MAEKFISLEAAQKQIDKELYMTESEKAAMKNIIRKTPAADVSPVVYGTPIIKHRHFGGFRQYTGVDAMGKTHTITVDERYECDAKHCPVCHALLCSRFDNYCSNCGAKMEVGAE